MPMILRISACWQLLMSSSVAAYLFTAKAAGTLEHMPSQPEQNYNQRSAKSHTFPEAAVESVVKNIHGSRTSHASTPIQHNLVQVCIANQLPTAICTEAEQTACTHSHELKGMQSCYSTRQCCLLCGPDSVAGAAPAPVLLLEVA